MLSCSRCGGQTGLGTLCYNCRSAAFFRWLDSANTHQKIAGLATLALYVLFLLSPALAVLSLLPDKIGEHKPGDWLFYIQGGIWLLVAVLIWAAVTGRIEWRALTAYSVVNGAAAIAWLLNWANGGPVTTFLLRAVGVGVVGWVGFAIWELARIGAAARNQPQQVVDQAGDEEQEARSSAAGG